jgi:superoxide reductase
MANYTQSADFKTEKHVPVIEAPEKVNAGEAFAVKVSVGKEVSHPNTTEHFIESITLYFKPDDGKFAVEIGRADFSAHGASAEGPNKGCAFTEPAALFSVKLNASGTLTAMSYCNIHGLWESSVKVSI